MHRALRVFLAIGLTAAPLSAQHPGDGYRRTPGDTLRYREVTSATTDFTSPQGPIPIETTHDATMSIAFGAADTARAWYDALHLSSRSPRGSITPATNGALRVPFVLLVDGRGAIRTLSAPVFPEEFEGVTDLTRQFDDYWIPLRPELLRAGASWTDTLAMHDSTGAGRVYAMHRVRHLRVRGDSAVDGERLLVLEIASVDSIDVRAPGARAGLTVRNVMRGTERETALWSPRGGVLVARSREGEHAGEVQLLGGPEPNAISMRRRFTSTLRLLP